MSSNTTTAFTGTARDYARYRPAYPQAFLADLRSRARTTGHGALLDLACGPGRVAIPMARHFARVLAVDVEPEVVADGERRANACGIANIAWLVARAEALQLAPGSLELVAIGEAFHRLDAARVLVAALEWLAPHGAIATLGGEPVWRGRERWQRVLFEVVNRWTGGVLEDPNAPWGGPVEPLRDAGLEVVEGEHATEHVWTTESLVGLMRSTSIASRRALGDDAERFASDLRASLLACDPSDRYMATQRFGFTIGLKRGDRD